MTGLGTNLTPVTPQCGADYKLLSPAPGLVLIAVLHQCACSMPWESTVIHSILLTDTFIMESHQQC